MILSKEKALELIEKFKINDYDWVAQGNDYVVKQHASLAVDEILTEVNRLDKKYNLFLVATIQYWEDVKQEIKNVKL